MLDVSRLISVQVSLSQPGALGRTFNNLLILGDSNVINGLQRKRDYTGLAEIAADFGTTSPEYLAALIYYQQKPKPINCTVGRWIRTATAGILEGSILTAAQAAISLFNTITNGGFHVTIDGSVISITGLNFSAQTNLNGVASQVTTALAGAGVCTWTGAQFRITSTTLGAGIDAFGTFTVATQPTPGDTIDVNGEVVTFVTAITGPFQVLIGGSAQLTAVNLNTFLNASASPNILEASYTVALGVVTATFKQPGVAGNSFTMATSNAHVVVSAATLLGGTNPSSVSYATAPVSGQDISAMMGLTAALALPLVPGYAAETALQAVVALNAIDTNWYGLMFAASVMPSDSDYLQIAPFIEADVVTRLFGVTTTNSNVLSSVVTNDIASQMKALAFQQSFVAYCSTNPYAAASMFGRLFTVSLSGSNTFLDLMYKQMPGIVAENIDNTQANALQSKRCNVFTRYDNDTSIVQYGVTCGPAYIDETYGDNALQNAIQTAVYNANYTTSTKVPQTDQGSNVYSNAISGACQQYVTNGFGASGVWNADGFGSLQTGQFLKLGYYIYAPPVSSQSEADRQARKSVPFQVAFKLAGSNQTVQVSVSVNQ